MESDLLLLFISLDDFICWPLAIVYVGLRIMSMDSLRYAWFVLRKERMEVGNVWMIIEVSLMDVVNFSTLENLRETLTKFFKISRLSLFRVPIFLAYA